MSLRDEINEDDVDAFKRRFPNKEDLNEKSIYSITNESFDSNSFAILHYMTELGITLSREACNHHFESACMINDCETASFVLDHIAPGYISILFHTKSASESSNEKLLAVLLNKLSQSELDDVLEYCLGNALRRTHLPMINTLIPFFKQPITDRMLIINIAQRAEITGINFETMSSLIGPEEALNATVKNERINKAWNDAPMGKPSS